MRWLRDPLIDDLDQERKVRKFLWFPKRLDNEWRWLETAIVKQKVMAIDVGGSMEWGRYKNKWIDIEWVD